MTGPILLDPPPLYPLNRFRSSSLCFLPLACVSFLFWETSVQAFDGRAVHPRTENILKHQSPEGEESFVFQKTMSLKKGFVEPLEKVPGVRR